MDRFFGLNMEVSEVSSNQKSNQTLVHTLKTKKKEVYEINMNEMKKEVKKRK